MSRTHHREDPLAAMRAVNPVSATALRETLEDEALERAMRRAIEGGDLLSGASAGAKPVAGGEGVRDGGGPWERAASFRGRRRLALGLAVGLICLAVAALVSLGGGPVRGTGQPSFAVAAIQVAEANPRLLVTAPGWSVTDAGEFEADEGEVTFANGGRRFTVRWYQARYYRRYLRDRALVSQPQRSTLLGRTATTVRYGVDRSGAEEFATMLAPEGPVFVEVRGAIGDRAAYDAVLRSLRPVGVDTWLEAMPRSVVGPAARARVVERMLRGVPLPPGFDRATLQEEDSVLNHYQLAVQVAGAVSCGWFESWISATKVGDAARADEAAAAMSTWRHWPMIPTIGHGGWAMNVKMAAEELAAGDVGRGPAGRVVNPDGSGYELGPAWATMLNCTDRYWRHPIKG
ncbi:MAG TPA: hypothetical protein VJQ84_09310 [Solirubrobacterales bacterium]|nr:hypothetical protein [Solirubrobacterales bacterium]